MSGEMACSRYRLVRPTAALIAALYVAALAGSAVATETNGAGLARCADLDIPAKPPQRVWCTTPSATLVIAHQSDPIMLEGTEVRVLSADLLGSAARVRIRVRNDTRADQGLSAGGQELYLNIGGERVDLATFRDVRFSAGEAKTILLDYPLTPEQLAAVTAGDGRLDVGVRPWHDGALPSPLVGVVRVRVAN